MLLCAVGVITGLALVASAHVLRTPGSSDWEVVVAATVLALIPAVLRWVATQRCWSPFVLGVLGVLASVSGWVLVAETELSVAAVMLAVWRS